MQWQWEWTIVWVMVIVIMSTLGITLLVIPWARAANRTTADRSVVQRATHAIAFFYMYHIILTPFLALGFSIYVGYVSYRMNFMVYSERGQVLACMFFAGALFGFWLICTTWVIFFLDSRRFRASPFTPSRLHAFRTMAIVVAVWILSVGIITCLYYKTRVSPTGKKGPSQTVAQQAKDIQGSVNAAPPHSPGVPADANLPG